MSRGAFCFVGALFFENQIMPKNIWREPMECPRREESQNAKMDRKRHRNLPAHIKQSAEKQDLRVIPEGNYEQKPAHLQNSELSQSPRTALFLAKKKKTENIIAPT
jgi:hypothetical protein